MPARETYLVQRVDDGTFRSVIGYSHRTAMKQFIADYRPPAGERFRVKPRGHGEWMEFKVESR